jgi:hypothetical protein
MTSRDHPLPIDLASRPLELLETAGPFWRIHETSRATIFFGRKGRLDYRFDDPAGRHGVLYCSNSPEGAFAETLLKGSKGKAFVDSARIADRSIAQLTTRRRLRVVNLADNHLARLGCDSRLFSDTAYEVAQAWSAALHDHPDAPDGLFCNARRDPSTRSLALFEDRVTGTLGVKRSIELKNPTYGITLDEILERYGAALI